MKKTFTTALLCLGLACSASAASLVAEWDSFTEGGAATTGSYTITAGDGGMSISNGVLTANNIAYANRTYVDITSAGLSLYDGITVSMTLSNLGASNGIIMGMAGDTTANLLTFRSTGTTQNGMMEFNGSGSNAANTNQASISSVFTDTPTVITFTSAYDATAQKVLFTMYADAEVVAKGSTSSDLTEENLTKLVIGGWPQSDKASTSLKLYDLAIYDGAMTATEVSALVVPEPATATLSLLALAGLAAHRRRK